MTSKYQDKWTMWHHKECIDGEPSSNNTWIYSAYSKYLAPKSVNVYKRVELFNQCADNVLSNPFDLRIDRLPNKPTPPLSKDEVVGMVSQGLITHDELEANNWNFCNLEYEKEPLSFTGVLTAIKALYQIRNEDRNYFWENKMEETYLLAFYLPLELQYYVKKFSNKKVNLLQILAFYFFVIFCLTKGDKSSRMILYLICKDTKHFLSKIIPEEKWIKDYFEPEHDFVKNLGDK